MAVNHWTLTDKRSKAAFHSGVMRLYKHFLRWNVKQHAADDENLAEVMLPSPSELLRQARLRYLGTISHCGLAAEWGLLAFDNLWWELIRDDCLWLWKQLCHSSSLQDPRAHFPAWLYLIQEHWILEAACQPRV